MPVFQQKNVSDQTQVGIWHISESIKELTELYQNSYSKPIIESNSETRVKQWIATRLLLKTFFIGVDINYDKHGKPILSNGWNISISHSGDYVAISINKKETCGIDIEKISTKVERIKHKFLNESDIENISSIKHLTLYWSAKEALYKYYGKKEVLFIENLFIENFSPSLNSFIGIINLPDFEKKLKMKWGKIEDYILVYTL